MQAGMREKLSSLLARFRELTEMLSDPEVVSSPERLRATAQEHARLRELAETYERWLAVESEREATEELARGEDAELAILAREERQKLEREGEELEARLQALLVPRDPLANKNAVLEIRAGTGGEEAALFARELFEMYRRYAERRGWGMEVLSTSFSDQGGFKEVIALVSGPEAYSRLRFESGVHRVQRVPVTEAQGRIHTSAVTVAVLAEADEIEVKIDESELKIDVFRAGGPGGQHVNTTDSAVRITHLPTGLVVVCQDERSQHKNRAKAMKILRARLLELSQEKQHEERATLRRNMVKSGDRSEKIRTYNFPQGRLTDHRIGLTLYQLDRVLEGELDPVLDPLIAHDTAERIAAMETNASAAEVKKLRSRP